MAAAKARRGRKRAIFENCIVDLFEVVQGFLGRTVVWLPVDVKLLKSDRKNDQFQMKERLFL
jgi:hypothetical protein